MVCQIKNVHFLNYIFCNDCLCENSSILHGDEDKMPWIVNVFIHVYFRFKLNAKQENALKASLLLAVMMQSRGLEFKSQMCFLAAWYFLCYDIFVSVCASLRMHMLAVRFETNITNNKVIVEAVSSGVMWECIFQALSSSWKCLFTSNRK